MTFTKKLYELLILGVIWGAVAALAVVINEQVVNNRGAYALMAVMVLATWLATEYILEILKIDTNYAPD